MLKRNREWFNKSLPNITECWNTILDYKKNGYDDLLKEHTKTKKPKKYEIPTFDFYDEDVVISNKNKTTNENTDKKEKNKSTKKPTKIKIKNKKTKKIKNDGPPKEIKLTF